MPGRLHSIAWVWLAWLGLAGASHAQEKVPPKPEAPKAKADQPKPAEKLAPGDFALPGEDRPKAFVPKTPRSSADLKKLEALREFAAGCSFEAQGRWMDALKAFEASLKADPEAPGATRRMARLSFALNRADQGVALCKKVLEANPQDIDTLTLLINHYQGRKNDLEAAGQVLRAAAENKKLDPNSGAALLIQYELGRNYAATRKLDKAADAFLLVVKGLDGKAGQGLSPAERRRLLGNDEGQSYLEFGSIFLATGKNDAAILAFEHGLVYDPENPQLLLLLGRAYEQAGRKAESLAVVERFLKRQPSGREAYDLLVGLLTQLKREGEILPKLEKAAKDNPKNVQLRYLLVERYRIAGQNAKADELSKELVSQQPDLQGFAAVFPTLLKDRKAEEMLRLMDVVTARIRNIEVFQPQLDKIAADKAFADEFLDTGLKLLSKDGSSLGRNSWFILIRLATSARKPEKLAGLLEWAIKQPQPPTAAPLLYRELASIEVDLGNFARAEGAVDELMRKFPEERNAQTLVLLGQVRARAGKTEPALAALKDALKLDPNESRALQIMGVVLSQAGRSDEAIKILRDAIKAAPDELQNYFTLASLLTEAGKSDEAIAQYRSILEKYATNDEAVRIARSNLSIIYTQKGDFAKGEAELEVLYNKDKDDPGVNNDLGYLYADQGKNLERAEAMIRKAVNAEPDNSSYLDSLGWVLFKRGKIKEALEPLEKAIQNPRNEDATILEHLGDVYFQLKDMAKARTAWEKAEAIAAKSKPPDKRLPDIRKKLSNLKSLQAAPRPVSGTSP